MPDDAYKLNRVKGLNVSKDKRETIARAKLLEFLGTEEGEFGPVLFVNHHKEELDSEYWQRVFGNTDPTPEEIIKGLVLVDSWASQEDGNFDTYDFSLPDAVTNYLVTVRFDGVDVSDVSMES